MGQTFYSKIIKKFMNSINYFIKQIYGKDTMYIDDPKIAKIITRLTQQKTLTCATMKALKDLGFTFNQILKK
jgi:hypothetical protein